MGTAAWRAAIALACSLPYGDDPMWEYQVVEEPNPVALQERLGRIARDGREEIDFVVRRRGSAPRARPATGDGIR
jgi:hypothetical protein